ncbi:MAG: right-handed parallel beta-helix repeat-containing protein, partial [candidate division Zixibacteria bacterium]|nr:right-handed parallel beta-helix repeat-containing protein [candidate division Zixibacteria bacterium]
MGKKTAAAFVIGCVIILFAYRFIAFAADSANDTPHNQDYDTIYCGGCHISSEFTNPSDTACLSCHKKAFGPYSATEGPLVKTHSSDTTSSQYAPWSRRCVDCHDPHRQKQKDYSENYLATGTIVSTGTYDSENNSTTLTYSIVSYRTGWEDPSKWADKTEKEAGYDKRGAILIPDTTNSTTSRYTYLIKSADASTITVIGDATTQIPSILGKSFKVIYGQLIKNQIYAYDPSDGQWKWKPVKFFDRTGTNSFADGDSTRDGPCEVCHTKTRHFRNDGSADDQLHTNMGTVAGTNCTACHAHDSGFAHGSGSEGTGCIPCHGHDEGTYYDPDMTLPYTANAENKTSQGRGTHQSHSTHTESISGISPSSAGDDDRKGPGIYCADCHDITKFPLFKDGKTLANTTVCDPCHSPGGTYDGVNDPVIGAKANWKSGVYEADSKTLQVSKEKWCAGCHDEEPGNSKPDDSGVDAPDVIGDEDGYYTYGTGWGFYKTGHGLAAEEAYPYKGGLLPPQLVNGASRPVNCDGCHDFSTAHIDHDSRTFNCGDGCNSTEYRQSYRLKLVDGKEPMEIPWTGATNANSTEKYRLCVSCHAPGPFVDPLNKNTNMYTWSDNNPDFVNRHVSHLSMASSYYPADYNYSSADTTKITCVICHNVHGSTRLAMVRDGKLINRQPGQEIWYYNPGISTDTTPPSPEDLPLSLSTAARWNSTTDYLCGNCHANSTSYRTPFQGVEEFTRLDWTDEYSYTNDGAYPDAALQGSTFTFRVKYSSTNTDPPAVIQLWIDLNDNGSYEAGEKFDLEEVDAVDTSYFNGKLYTINLQVNSAGDNVIKYRFYAKDSDASEATGSPTGDSYISLLAGNRPPELAWVEVANDCRHEGVSPAAEGSGQSFDFRVQYTDADNNAPTIKQVWVDANNSGVYDDPNEKYDMTETDVGDTTYTDGKLYTKAITLNTSGSIKYKFVFSDGTDTATGDPAADHTVTVISSATPPTVCASGCTYSTIQAAVDAMSSNQTVLVKPGTYNEKVYFDSNDNNKYVRSRCGYEETTIDATGKTYGVQVSSTSTGSVVDGFQIKGGTTGVYVSHSSDHPNITIEDCDVHDNVNASADGGGVYLWRSDINIKDSIIRSNKALAGSGGGIYSSSTGSKVTVTNSIIQQNEAATGGGLFSGDGTATATFDKSLIISNKATSNGGAIYNWEAVTLTNTVVAGNTAEDSGGGIYVRDGGSTSANNCTFADNTATTGQGGAFYNWIDNILVKNSILWNNSAPATKSGHISFSHSTSTVSISDSVISNDHDGVYDNPPYFDKDDGTITVSGFVSEDDPFFVDSGGGDYHILHRASSAIDNANAATATAYDIDGDNRPQGDGPDIGADEYLAATVNNPPVLAWTGEAGYADDGVDPDDGDATTTFTFRVDYFDDDGVNGDPPSSIQLWIDENDDGVFGLDERYTMDEVDGEDVNFKDGKRYAKSMKIGYYGDGRLNYRFFAEDGKDEASGLPTDNRTITLINSVPTLDWTSETNYESDGVEPNSAAGGTTFTFRVKYTDKDNKAPETIQAWVDQNDNGYYEPDEKYSLTLVSGGDGDYSNGEIFTGDVTLFYAGDGVINYRFYAKDNATAATGAPTSDQTVTIETGGNTSPLLRWTNEANYTDDGVDPERGEDNNNSFAFRVLYSDANGDAPGSIELWVDLNDDGDFNDTVYGKEEKQILTKVGTGEDYVNGEIYSVTLTNLLYAGDGYLNYRFYANDGKASASGEPVSADKTVWIYHLRNVSCGGKIQDAIDAAVDGDLVRVAECTYEENISFAGKKITVESVNKDPGMTFIVGNGSNTPVVSFMGGETSAAVLDGFTIDNQALADSASRGIYITSNSSPTIRNSVIKGNKVITTWVNGSGIYIYNGSATIENTTIGGDAANQNECAAGCGIYAEALSGPLTISGSTVSQNRTGNTGAGIYLINNGTQVSTITNT